jgi:FOG: PKD repeat
MSRARTQRISTRIGLVVGLMVGAMPFVATAPAHALPNTATPSLTLARTIRTTPYVGTSSSMRDGEGSAFVPNDPAHPNIGGTDSLWIAEDNGKAVWEVNPYTGVLKSSIQDATWQATKQYSSSTGTGSGASAGSNRDPDIESMAYDKINDTLYVFSGKCCKSSVLPTSYRLKRGAGNTFHPEAWQALPAGSDYTASAWHPGDHKVYVGVGSAIRTYDFPTNASGSTFSVTGVSGIYGMSFSDDGNDLFVANSSVKLLRANWNTKALVTGWSIDLKPFGMKDSRAVELINDQFYVLDGYDGRSTGDPLRYAVFVFNVCCGSGQPPVASFTTAQLANPNFTIQFTDTSSNSPTAWTWDFDNNGTVDSTVKNPTFTFSGAGDFTVKHTASNSGGNSTPVTQTVHVNAPGPPVANFSSAAAASPPLTVTFTDTSTGGPTSWAWDFNNDTITDSTLQNPSHTFASGGDYPVTLTVTNLGGPASVTKTVTVSPPAPPVANFSSAAAASPPLTVNFTDTSTGGPTSWAWDFNNDTITDSTLQNPLHTFASAGGFLVTLTVDNGFGPSSVTKTVTVSDQPIVTTLNPVADSYVSASSPTKNYATYTDLKALAFNGTYEYHPYFQFSVTGLGGAPASAKLRLYVTDGGPSGGNWFSPIGSWTESTINWNNAPLLTGSPFVSVGTATAGQWIEIDVTAQITGNGTFTFAATSPSTNIVTFSSRETAFAPQLVLTAS